MSRINVTREKENCVSEKKTRISKKTVKSKQNVTNYFSHLMGKPFIRPLGAGDVISDKNGERNIRRSEIV
jgi:hypothetical protein